MSNLLQRSEEWHAQRCGKVTASRIKGMYAKAQKGKVENDLTLTLIAERDTGKVEGFKPNADMQWGINQEQNAIAAYENLTNNFVTGAGFVPHPAIKMGGASPDGYIDDDGLIEVKCPKTKTHTNTRLSKKIPNEYKLQIAWQMACTARKWCDFVSYDPRILDKSKQLVIIRVTDDELGIEQLEKDVISFNKRIEELMIGEL